MKKELNYNQLHNVLEDLYGEVLSLLEECPGVYYASVRQDEADTFPHEYYIVYKAADSISRSSSQLCQPYACSPCTTDSSSALAGTQYNADNRQYVCPSGYQLDR